MKVREDRQIRAETVLKYSNYNIKADELLVGFASNTDYTHRHVVPYAVCLLKTSDPCSDIPFVS